MDGATEATPSLGAIPFDAPRRRRGRDVVHDVKQGLDFVAHNLPRAHGVFVRLNPYPRPWRSLTVDGIGGAKLAAWYAAGRPGAPAVLFAPGTFQTKDDTPRKRRAIDLWRRLGASVLILDLRGFGGSHALAGTAGFHESRDLLLAADRLLAESGADRAILWGESLGGAASLLSGALPGASARYKRIIAWSPFADLRDVGAISDPTTDIGRSALGRTYRWLVRHRTSRASGDFSTYFDHCARELQLAPEELMSHCSPVEQATRLSMPAFVFHAEDDPVVSVSHAQRLAALELAQLRVQLLPRGGHLDFDRVAPHWYRRVTEQLILGAPEAG